jgi:hypothetical protein
MWITGGSDARIDPFNLDHALTIQGRRVDEDHYGVYAVIKLPDRWETSDMVLLTQTVHTRESHGYTEQDWSEPIIKDILLAIERGDRVYRFGPAYGVPLKDGSHSWDGIADDGTHSGVPPAALRLRGLPRDRGVGTPSR